LISANGKRDLWTAAEVAAASAVDHEADWRASGVCIDSRVVESGDLFVAIEGPRFDGHDFIAEAFSRGAVAAMAHRQPIGLPGNVPIIMVNNTMAALRGLARAARERAQARVIAVTGSVGKTGTKEALKWVLGQQAPSCASESSYNNHLGLPLSLARMPKKTAFGIFEMGMNHAGEIEPLSRLASPHVALITSVEVAHSAYFANLDEIADAKAEVFTGMPRDGIVVLNRDNPYFHRLAAAARRTGVKTILAFGADSEATVRLLESSLGPEGSHVKADMLGEILDYRVGLPGRHWVINSLAVLAAVRAVGGNTAAAAAAIDSLPALPGRGQRHHVRLADGGFQVIDESYNANPASVTAALEVLGLVVPGAGGRRIAVLGDMLELGTAAADEHAALALPLQRGGIDLVFTAGMEMARLSDILPRAMRGGHAADARRLAPMVTAAAGPGDVICVKGSAASNTKLIVEALLALDEAIESVPPQRVVNGD
jgi:UDP-N-acetylmuramoyl-tripeptide--D-alanyl-D-alanine ligase